jgi:hypothetical protein
VRGTTHRRFWKCFEELPAPVQKLAAKSTRFGNAIRIILPYNFEERRNGICVLRLGDRYRGLREGDVIAWFWIGTHEQYNRFQF